MKDNKNVSVTYISNRRKAEENPLLDVQRNKVTKNDKKVDMPFFASVCNGKTSCSLGIQSPELEDKDEDKKEAPEIQGKMVSDPGTLLTGTDGLGRGAP